MKEPRYTLELSESQLLLIAQCVEDCHRFLAGQTELQNTVSCLDSYRELTDKLKDIKPLVTPELQRNESYGWSGGECPNGYQRQRIAETYYLYREIVHQLTIANRLDNVYSSETLRCKDSGEPIKIIELK